jgi:hypothetical protein
MQTKAAFEAIQRALSKNPRRRVVRSSFDERVFGNFVIAFVEDGQPASLVNDRGQLLLYRGLEADEYRLTLLENLYEADEATVIEALA